MTGVAGLMPVKIRNAMEFSAEKAVQTIMYIANKLGKRADMYRVLKAVYFADKQHLQKWGRLIYGDDYLAMNYGPVPINAYNMVRYVRDGRLRCEDHAIAQDAFRLEGYRIVPYANADTDFFSQSELECLDKGIAECRNLSFNALKARSHDKAYERADKNSFMTVEDIASTLPNKNALLKFLRDPFPE